MGLPRGREGRYWCFLVVILVKRKNLLRGFAIGRWMKMLYDKEVFGAILAYGRAKTIYKERKLGSYIVLLLTQVVFSAEIVTATVRAFHKSVSCFVYH